jgi:hypothetical protein
VGTTPPVRSPAIPCTRPGSGRPIAGRKSFGEQIRDAVRERTTRLLEVGGVGPVPAGRLLGRTRGARRFKGSSLVRQLRRRGSDPIEVAGAERSRHQLPRGGDRYGWRLLTCLEMGEEAIGGVDHGAVTDHPVAGRLAHSRDAQVRSSIASIEPLGRESVGPAVAAYRGRLTDRSPCGTSTSPEDVTDATVLLKGAIAGCRADEVPEIVTLGRTLERWRGEILNHHRTGVSNGRRRAGLLRQIKHVKRAGRGFQSFENCRLRLLLRAGGFSWPRRPRPPKVRGRSPQSNA